VSGEFLSSSGRTEDEYRKSGENKRRTDLARKHHPSEILHITRRLDVNDRNVLGLGVGEDLGLGSRKIVVKDRIGQDRIGRGGQRA
jgi:hypothetical protein